MYKLLVFTFCLILSANVLAETFYGIGVTRFNLKNAGTEVRATAFTVGYKFGKRNFSLNPQLQYFKENYSNIWGNNRITLDSAFLLSLKAQYTYDSGIYLLATPALGSFTYRSEYSSGEEEEFELGIDLGLGYEFNKYLSTEVTYGLFTNSDALTASVSFRF